MWEWRSRKMEFLYGTETGRGLPKNHEVDLLAGFNYPLADQIPQN
jgi:hypothetical protein